MSGSPRAARAVLAAALALAVAAAVTAIVRDSEPAACAELRRRLEPYLSEEPTQRWDDIYTLQTDVSEGLLLRHEAERLGCLPSHALAHLHARQ